MDSARDQFLAGARWPHNHHGYIGRGNAVDSLGDYLHLGRPSDNFEIAEQLFLPEDLFYFLGDAILTEIDRNVAVDKIILRLEIVTVGHHPPDFSQAVVAADTRRHGMLEIAAGVIDQHDIDLLFANGLIKLRDFIDNSADLGPVDLSTDIGPGVR